MNTMKEVNETRITLRSHEAVVENVNNGISMNRRTVIPSDLAISMLGILEDEAIVTHLLREKSFDQVFEGFFNLQNYNGEPLIEEMNAIIDLAFRYIDESDCDSEVLNSFFLTLVSRFDPNDFSEKETIKALRRFLSKVREFENSDIIHELFYYLLDEVNLLGDLKGAYAGRILKQLLTRARNSLDKEMIHSLFQVTSNVADQEWVLEVLERYIPKKKACSSPLLPKNCFIYQEMMDGAKLVGIEVEAQRFDIQYHRKRFEEVGHPKLLFLFTLRGQRVLSCKIVCVKDQVLTPETQLYRYPFSNVHNNTSTCWPDLRSYQMKSIAHVGTMPFAFIHSQNNEHLFIGVNLGEKYNELQGKDFDHDTLELLDLSFAGWLEVSKKTLN
ncbi:hypothetical protein BKP35_12115 [Anaerobacillus arseniciselenatis]|uniref:Uncharacterized protein n=1 Tax=Anaerobacillus arseniciselenatis TaxID=85682 RepID=A0A1S2LGI0_9BACI|nr:hypothetical protein [Anaerobacillus arseniciselenatis]OIJ11481.1 hypothetical protein BKP35_12115 [Anaerobacillus arseniciselenatis]